MSENSETTPSTAEDQKDQNANDSGLSVSDLAAMKNIIDVASERGAFKPNEMVVVGRTYNKLTAFLDEIAKQNTNTQG